MNGTGRRARLARWCLLFDGFILRGCHSPRAAASPIRAQSGGSHPHRPTSKWFRLHVWYTRNLISHAGGVSLWQAVHWKHPEGKISRTSLPVQVRSTQPKISRSTDPRLGSGQFSIRGFTTVTRHPDCLSILVPERHPCTPFAIATLLQYCQFPPNSPWGAWAVYFPHVTGSVRRGMVGPSVLYVRYCTGGPQYSAHVLYRIYCRYCTGTPYSTPFSVWTRPFGLSAVLSPAAAGTNSHLQGSHHTRTYCRVTQAQRAGESPSPIHHGRVRFGEGGRRDWWDPVYLFVCACGRRCLGVDPVPPG
jgi:hypothetical protein